MSGGKCPTFSACSGTADPARLMYRARGAGCSGAAATLIPGLVRRSSVPGKCPAVWPPLITESPGRGRRTSVPGRRMTDAPRLAPTAKK